MDSPLVGAQLFAVGDPDLYGQSVEVRIGSRFKMSDAVVHSSWCFWIYGRLSCRRSEIRQICSELHKDSIHDPVDEWLGTTGIGDGVLSGFCDHYLEHLGCQPYQSQNTPGNNAEPGRNYGTRCLNAALLMIS